MFNGEIFKPNRVLFLCLISMLDILFFFIYIFQPAHSVYLQLYVIKANRLENNDAKKIAKQKINPVERMKQQPMDDRKVKCKQSRSENRIKKY